MSTLIKSSVRTLIQELIDDASAAFWSAGNLDLLTEICLDECHGDLLEHAPWLSTVTERISSFDSPGTLNLASALAAPDRPYKILKVQRDERTYRYVSPWNVMYENSTKVSVPDYTYTIVGNILHMFPYDTSTTVEITYNTLEAKYTGIADGAAFSTMWPDGMESAFIFLVASRAILKGDREEGDRLAREAAVAQKRLYARIAKPTGEPVAINLYSSLNLADGG